LALLPVGNTIEHVKEPKGFNGAGMLEQLNKFVHNRNKYEIQCKHEVRDKKNVNEPDVTRT